MTLKEYYEKLDEKEVESVKQFYVENIDYSEWGDEWALMCEVRYKDGEIKHYCYPASLIDWDSDFRAYPLDDAVTLTESELKTAKDYLDVTDHNFVDEGRPTNCRLKLIEKIKYRRNNKELCEALDKEEKERKWWESL